MLNKLIAKECQIWARVQMYLLTLEMKRYAKRFDKIAKNLGVKNA
jgi:hypothetical protein